MAKKPLLTDPRRGSAKRLAIYNHKGGVGKTTLTVNLAYALVDLGKTVLLVDSDPQCNLTSYLIADQGVNRLLDESDSPNGQTVWSAVKPISEASGPLKIVPPIKLEEKLHLIPGDIRLSEFDYELTQYWGDCVQRRQRGFNGTTALSQLIAQVSIALKADYTFYDCGPNIGPLNRAVLLDCDWFVIPAACDLFSVRALSTLGHSLQHWISNWRVISELAPDNTYLLPGMPKLLGYILHMFKVYRGQPTIAHANYLPEFEKHIYSDVVTLLQSIDKGLVPFPVSKLKIGEVKNFGSLAIAAQEQGLPIGNVNAGTPAQRQASQQAFARIAKRIVQATGGR